MNMNQVKDLIGETIKDIKDVDGDLLIKTSNYEVTIIDPLYPGESFKFEVKKLKSDIS